MDKQVNNFEKLFAEFDDEGLRKLRRRIEDLLRKSPSDLRYIAALLAHAGRIKWQDITDGMLRGERE
jgi:hypothetical protein